MRRVATALLPSAIALLLALVIGDILILSVAQSPGTVYRMLLQGTWGNPYGLGQVIYKATTLTFTGLAVALALRGGLFNIGAEAQLASGGFAAGLAGMLLPAATPGVAAALLCATAAALAGGCAGAIPGALAARFGAHEVIVTIMLNFVVLAVLNWIVAGHLHVPETLHTPPLSTGTLPRLSVLASALHGSAANASAAVALAAAVVVWWYLFRSPAGFELRAVGLQPAAAETAGIRIARVRFRALTLSGVVAGLGGINFVLGYKHYYEDGFAGGAGFLGIAVALAGGNHPVGVVVAALAFATLSQGGLAIHAVVPKQMTDVLQGVVILAVAAAAPQTRSALASATRRAPAPAPP